MRYLVLLMVAGGCSSTQIPGNAIVVIDVDSEFFARTVFDNSTGQQLPAIEAVRLGAHAWDVAGARLFLRDELPANVQPKASFGIHWSDIHLVHTAGVCWPGLGYADIYMSNIDGSQNLINTVAHELGHAMGMQHIDQSGVMNPIGNNQALSTADIAEFRSLWAVND